jgi:hypothetical protein
LLQSSKRKEAISEKNADDMEGKMTNADGDRSAPRCSGTNRKEWKLHQEELEDLGAGFGSQDAKEHDILHDSVEDLLTEDVIRAFLLHCCYSSRLLRHPSSRMQSSSRIPDLGQ